MERRTEVRVEVFTRSFFGINAENSSNGGFVVGSREGCLQGHVVGLEVFNQVGVFAFNLSEGERG